MALALKVPFHFKAYHWLSVRPEKHMHSYELVLEVSGNMQRETGFILDMLELRSVVEEELKILRNATLNDHSFLKAQGESGAYAARYPTCEALALFFGEFLSPKISELAPEAQLSRVSVKILEEGMAGAEKEYGWAELTL